MITVSQIQECRFTNFYKNNTLKQLNELKSGIQEMENLCINLFSQLRNMQKDYSKKLKLEIDNFIKWVNNLKENNFDNNIIYKNQHNETIKDLFNKYLNDIGKDLITKINNHIKDLESKLEDIIDGFDPPNMNNSSDEKISLDLKSSYNDSNSSNKDIENYIENIFYSKENLYEEIYGFNEDNENNNKEFPKSKSNESNLKCSFCSLYIAYYYCKNSYNYYCKSCGKQILDYGPLQNYNLITLNEIKSENEKNKKNFLKCFINIIKNFSIKCNYILKNENQNFVDPNSYQKFKYPSINIGNNSFNSQIDFLAEINDVYQFIKEKIDINNSINENDICDLLINSLENMFEEKKAHISKNIEEIDDELYFINEKYEPNKENDNTFDNIKNKFLYVINIINKKNYNNYNLNDSDDSDIIKNKIISSLSINKDEIYISSNNILSLTNIFIKYQKFSKISPKTIRIKFPKLEKLYEFKLLIDGLIRYRYKISEEFLDYRYNFIIPNLSLNFKKGTEIYNPPYGWFGIGLKVLDKYDGGNNDWIKRNDKYSKWANAYYGFDKNLNEENIRDILKNIVKNNYIEQNCIIQKNCLDWDKRHKGKRIGVGIYVTPNINFLERNCKEIVFNNKKYKISLMSKVLIEKIKEPEYGNYWILNEKYVRIYRILLKEVL